MQEQLDAVTCQSRIRPLLETARNRADSSSALDEFLQHLATLLGAQSAMLWQVVDDHMEVTNEFGNNAPSALGRTLDPKAFMRINNALTIDPTAWNKLHYLEIDLAAGEQRSKWQPFLRLENSSTLIALDFRYTETVVGFLAIEFVSQAIIGNGTREQLQYISLVISVLIGQIREINKLALAESYQKTAIKLLTMPHPTPSSENSFRGALQLIREQTGFVDAQLFLHDSEIGSLRSNSDLQSLIHPSNSDDIIAKTFNAAQPHLVKPTMRSSHCYDISAAFVTPINIVDSNANSQQYFGDNLGLLYPIFADGKTIGVLLLVWSEAETRPIPLSVLTGTHYLVKALGEFARRHEARFGRT